MMDRRFVWESGDVVVSSPMSKADPTSDSVHVPAPLGSFSVAYGNPEPTVFQRAGRWWVYHNGALLGPYPTEEKARRTVIFAKALLAKFNANHDEKGRFASAPAGEGGAPTPSLFSAMAHQGGLTWQPVSGHVPTSGYVVSLSREQGTEKVVDAKTFFSGPKGKEEGRAMMRDYLKANWARFSDPTIHFGGWHDTEGGKVYLDLSEVHGNLADATRVGSARGQVAVYDLGKGEEVRL